MRPDGGESRAEEENGPLCGGEAVIAKLLPGGAD